MKKTNTPLLNKKMGIRLLNRLINQYSKNGVSKITLLKLRGKKIAIDISIYLYKYASMGTLIENIYLLCSTLKFYNIEPICIFDGPCPKEKMDEIAERRQKKQEAEAEYIKLEEKKEKLVKISSIKKIEKEMKELQRRFTTVTRKDREEVKKLLLLMGVSYYKATGEADELCAKMVLSGEAYACLSEDMDMFVYGCPRVLRYLSLRKHTVIIYDMESILNDLNMNLKQFRTMCIMAGTDYKKSQHSHNVFYYYKQFVTRKYLELDTDSENIYKLFDIKNCDISRDKLYTNLSIEKTELYKFLENYGFVFI